jgi:O-antigen ligase
VNPKQHQQHQTAKSSPHALAIVVAIGLYLFSTSTLYPLDFLSVFDAKRILQLLLFFLVIVVALTCKPVREASVNQLAGIPKSITYLCALFFLIGILSSLRLDHPAYALLDVSMLFVILLLSLVTAASRDVAGLRFDKIAVTIIAFMGLAVSVQEFMGFLMGWVTGTEFSYELVLVHFANPRFYNHLQTLFIPLLVLLPYLYPQKRWIKQICLVMIGLQWFLIFSTGARGSFISLLAAMSFIALWLPAAIRHWLRPQLAGLLIGVLIYGLVALVNDALISKPGNFFEHSVGRSMMHTSGRTLLWQLSLDDVKDHPFLGSGPARFACDIENPPIPLPAHPHSFPIRIMGEWGGVAFLILMGLGLFIGIKYLVNLKLYFAGTTIETTPDKIYESVLLPTLAICIAAGVIHATVSGLLIMPASQTAIVLISGWALSANRREYLKPHSRWLPGLILCSGLIIVTVQIWFAGNELETRRQLSLGNDEISHRLTPRFWWTGKTCSNEYSAN